MINAVTKNRISSLKKQYQLLFEKSPGAVREITMAELPEMVYNSNAIENSTLSLKETSDIIMLDKIAKDHDIREIYEAKNLAEVMVDLLDNPQRQISNSAMLSMHRTLLTKIQDDIAGRYRHGKEWVRIGAHVGANPDFVPGLMQALIENWNTEADTYFLNKIAYFHAEFETIHPFVDGNGRIGRVLINQQLVQCGYPPIIIQNKSKHTDYYPLFDEYRLDGSHDGFTELFALLLIESLHKRIARLTAPKIILVSDWAKVNNIAGNSAANKAARQTIPAFRLNEKWMIAADYKPQQKGIN